MKKIFTANKILSVIFLAVIAYMALPLIERQEGCVDAQCIPIPSSYPVGSIYLSTVPTSPAVTVGVGTWVRIAQGRALIGAGTGAGLTNRTAGQELGWEDAVNVQHRHTMNNTFDGRDSEGGNGDDVSMPRAANTGWSGISGVQRNMQPSLVVYIWERTG